MFRWKSLSAGFLVAVLGLAETQAAPPVLDRRSRDEPEVIIEAGGRSGPADVLTYTPDGKNILAAGDDKVVRQWKVFKDGVDTHPESLHTLRWPAWREQRGGIKCLALSPDGKKVAIGGFGLRNSTVAILERATGEMLALSWPKSRLGMDSFNTVMAVAFHPDGERVAIGTADGSVFFWNPKKLAEPDNENRNWAAPQRVGRHERMREEFGSKEFNLPRLLWFTDKDTLLSLAQSGEVLSCDVGPNAKPVELGDAPAAKSLFNVNKDQKLAHMVYRAELTDDGKTLVMAMRGPLVLFHSVDGKTSSVINLEKDTYARSIAISKDGKKLALGVATAETAKPGENRFYIDNNDKIWVYENDRKGAAKPVEIKHSGPAEAMSWKPGTVYLAVAGGDSHELSIYDTSKPASSPFVASGAGRKLWGVALSEDGKTLGFRPQRNVDSRDVNNRSQGDWLNFELPKLNPTKKDVKWLTPATEGDGWKLVPDTDSRFKWHVVKRNLKFELPWDKDRDQAPTCYTFLPSFQGSSTRLLVGHYYGASLFELSNEGPVRVKLFNGHTGEVLSIAVAKDQSWFITGGSDGTIAAYSMKDWTNQPILGVDFEEKKGLPVVKNVAIGSPGWEAGLEVGDKVHLFAHNGTIVFEPANTKRTDQMPIAKVMETLKAPQSSVEFGFVTEPAAGGALTKKLTTVRQRPLWKFFPAFTELTPGKVTMNEWVLWMWKGSYYVTSTNGDRLVGWHVNHPTLDGRPEFYTLNQFQKFYNSERVILELLSTRDVEGALKIAYDGNPQRPDFAKSEPAPVRIALENSVVNQKGVAFQLVVEQRGTNPDLLPDHVEVWLNDFRWKSFDPKRTSVKERFTMEPALFRDGDNKITVITYNPLGGRAERQELVVNPTEGTESQLLGLSVGANNYDEHRKALVGFVGKRTGFEDLKCAVKDATVFGATMDNFRGENKYYKGTGLTLLLDAKANRDSLLAAIAKVAKTAKPNDHLIVFFAGHGDLLDSEIKEGEKLPPGARGLDRKFGDFVLCCPDYSLKTPKETSLSAVELVSELSKINCRKTVILDACHSGRAAERNLVRRLVPEGQGPVIIAACNQNEFSFEHPDPKIGHGVFTKVLIDALTKDFDKANKQSNGNLTTVELFNYLSAKVPDLASAVTKGAVQDPICFPQKNALPRTTFAQLGK